MNVLRAHGLWFALGAILSLACLAYGFTLGVEHTERTDLVTVAVRSDGRVLVTVFNGWGEVVMRREQNLDDPISTMFDY